MQLVCVCGSEAVCISGTFKIECEIFGAVFASHRHRRRQHERADENSFILYRVKFIKFQINKERQKIASANCEIKS